MFRLPLRTWLLGVLLVMLVLALFGWRAGCQAAKQAKSEADLAVATGKALDKVAEQTPVIRQEQAEKEDEVDKITGADEPLPPGFGAELERVRRGQPSHSR